MTVKLNLARINSIQNTMEAIEEIEQAMAWYEDTSKAGPAYMTVRNPNNSNETVDLQFERQHYLEFMEHRRQNLIKHIEERYGFKYDPDAHWAGDDRG